MTKQQFQNAYAEKVRQVDELRELWTAEVAKVAELEAKLAEAREDVERIDWLEKNQDRKSVV